MRSKPNPALRYVGPFVLFMLLTECQNHVAQPFNFAVYAAKSLITGAAVWFLFRKHASEISGKWNAAGVITGAVAAVLWIALCKLFYSGKGNISFDPGLIQSDWLRLSAVGFRIFGAVVIVPVVEELMWRAFLMRYLVTPDFLSIPPGTCTRYSLSLSVIAFVLVHRSWEWPAAIAVGLLYSVYLVKSGNLKGCILAHATTNLILAVYICYFKSWYLW